MPRRSKSDDTRDRHDDFLSESDLSSSSSASSEANRERKEPYRDVPTSATPRYSQKDYAKGPALASSDEESSQLEDEEKLIGQMISDKKKKANKTKRLWTMRSGPGDQVVSDQSPPCMRSGEVQTGTRGSFR